jgi:molybdopterin molybdotransferase
MISAEEALRIVLESVAPLGVERVSITAALGRVLAEEIRSPRDIPGFANSAMDGYAVRAADVASASEKTPVRLRVLETVAAGMMPTHSVSVGETSRTMTGAPLASGADAIVPVERTRDAGSTVEILAPAAEGAFVRPRGEDLKQGELVIAAGKRLSAGDIGMLASLNRAVVDVIRRPRVAIVATGDELVDIDEPPTGAQIVNSSAYALAAAVSEAGGEAIRLKVARDTVGSPVPSGGSAGLRRRAFDRRRLGRTVRSRQAGARRSWPAPAFSRSRTETGAPAEVRHDRRQTGLRLAR